MSKLRQFDWILMTAIVLLLTVSIAVIFSTTFDQSGGATDALQQGFFVAVGFGLIVIFGMTDYRIFRRSASLLYVGMVVSLVAVKFIGASALGAQRWIDVGFFRLQPSEFAKIVMAIVLAKIFADHQKQLTGRVFVRSLAYTLVPVLLVASQPDFGTAMVIMATWLGMAIASGIPKRYFTMAAAAGLAVFPILWFFIFHDYQKKRILTFLNPANDPLGAGYNVKQAQIAVGSGGLWGQALGQGTQSQLNFLPVQHTDFIFAVLAEELGFIGALFTLGLLGLIAWRALAIAGGAKDFFGYQLAIGILTIILFQTLVNVGMNTGIMPVTGIPLPFVSYGGSSILMLLFAVGLLMSIGTRREGRFGQARPAPVTIG